MDDLQVLQNKATRIILDLPPRASSTDALTPIETIIAQISRTPRHFCL